MLICQPMQARHDVLSHARPRLLSRAEYDRFHERSLNGRPKNADAGALRGAVEVGTELTVVVSDDELGPDAEVRGLAHLLCRPLRGRVPRNANMNDLLGIDVHDEEREDRTKPNVVYGDWQQEVSFSSVEQSSKPFRHRQPVPAQ